MGNIVLIEGESGTGKSTAMETLALMEELKKQTTVFNVASKRPPFRSDGMAIVNHADYTTIREAFKMIEKRNAWKKIYIFDDCGYLLSFDCFNRAKETGYQKFTDMAVNFYNLVKYAIEVIPDDTNVYFIMHTERSEDGHVKAKTLGKMIDNQLCLEGLFGIVLLAQTDGKRHWFTTQSDGYSTAKSPKGMFPAEIDNDLAYVDTTIREYYGMEPIIKNNEQEKTA
jgi:hypothetical protein